MFDEASFVQTVKVGNKDAKIIKFMQDNDVWDFTDIPDNFKPIGYKMGFKTKRDSKGTVERSKAGLVAKRFTQLDGIDFNDTFSISSKDSFRLLLHRLHMIWIYIRWMLDSLFDSF